MSAYRWVRRCLWQAYCRVARPSLETLAAHHRTDKLTHGYIDAYAHWFAGRRFKALNLLEIGVGGYDVPQDGGNSLRMWRDFFPRAMIHAIDIADKSPHVERRVRIFQGSQADPVFLRDVAGRIGRMDIIIDDGSHVSSHVIASFTTLFPLLAGMFDQTVASVHAYPGIVFIRKGRNSPVLSPRAVAEVYRAAETGTGAINH